MEKTQKIKFIVSLVFAAGIFAVLPITASAATLYFSPSSGSYAIGATFSVSVYVSNADQAMNAASGVISFPTDKLSVEALSKSGSIFTLWVQEPSFSNFAGTVNFEGIVLNPGFTGSSGKAITITFRAKGETKYPNSQIIVWLQKEKDDPKSFTVQSDQDGKFTFTADEKLGDGIYRLWAEVVDERGAKSLPSEKITIAIAKQAILQVGSWVVSLLVVVIPLVALIFVFLFIVWYGWYKFSLLRKRIRKEVRGVESALHRAFDTLKEDIREQIKLLEKTRSRRQLTEEEKKIVKQLKEDLDTAEEFVKKEIEDIEKEVK